MFSSMRFAGVIAALTVLTVTVLTSLAPERSATPAETPRSRAQSGETRVWPPVAPANVRIIDLGRARTPGEVVVLPAPRRAPAA